ncbi:zinc ribbon domain-containing protein [Patescibacteria group bacterium]
MEFPRGSICQSCGMPLKKNEDFGTNADGGKSQEYCFHCFKDGKFLDEGITLQGKIEKSIKFGVQMGMTEEMARQMCGNILPKLKRWRKE